MSDFRDLYKNSSQLKEQQLIRRSRLLEDQKRQREDEFSCRRDLKEILTNNSGKKQRLNHLFKNNLMLSEWMMVRPDDVEDFILVPCPKGIRCSLSTGENKRKTAILYHKNGCQFMEIRTNIPFYTILDCIYDRETETLYILDVIAYGGRDLIDCDAEFRFFWIKSRFTEDNLTVTNDKKQTKLELVKTVDMMDVYSVRTCFQTHPIFDSTELDGFLFYHKKGSYTAGETPLVLWLFAFMIDELLEEFPVNQFYTSTRPENYTNYLEFISDFDKKMRKKKGRKSLTESMDTSNEEFQAMIDLEMTGGDV